MNDTHADGGGPTDGTLARTGTPGTVLIPQSPTAIVPRVGIGVRAATAADVPFIDALQKRQADALGFLPTAALLGKIKLGQVLVAETGVGFGLPPQASDGTASRTLPAAESDGLRRTPVGYLIAADRYCRRDEVGYVTQMAVVPEYRRHLVAAALLQAQFDRAAYGCRLFCCWCAQDLAANDFWAAMGFTPIAFRTGSRTKGKGKDGKAAPRIHLFWQKRVKAGDTTTPWWYPAKTEGGEMREDRLVFPIPPGVHWRDVLPVVLPGREAPTDALPALPPPPKSRLRTTPQVPPVPVRPPGVPKGGFWFAPEWVPEPEPTAEEIAAEKVRLAAERKAYRALVAARRGKLDGRLIEMARELRDRWAEQADPVLALPGKHDVRKALAAPATARPAVSVEFVTPSRRALPMAA